MTKNVYALVNITNPLQPVVEEAYFFDDKQLMKQYIGILSYGVGAIIDYEKLLRTWTQHTDEELPINTTNTTGEAEGKTLHMILRHLEDIAGKYILAVTCTKPTDAGEIEKLLSTPEIVDIYPAMEKREYRPVNPRFALTEYTVLGQTHYFILHSHLPLEETRILQKLYEYPIYTSYYIPLPTFLKIIEELLHRE